jgi:hypothetical protein
MWPMVIMLAGSAIQAGGGVFGASQALKQSKYQQDILGYQARYVEAANEINVEKVKRNVAQTISAQRAQTAASGFQPDTGTPLELQIDTQLQGEIDIALLRQSGGIEQLRLQNSGTMARAQGYGVAAGLYGQAAGSLLSTATSMGNRLGWFATDDTEAAEKAKVFSNRPPRGGWYKNPITGKIETWTP